MPIFARSFATRALADWDAANPDNAVRLLFKQWALPGRATTSDMPLRLGLRDGYINFYVKGQSVAKLSIRRGDPKLAVHNAYVSGRHRGDERDGATPVQNYIHFDARTLADPATAVLVAGWIETAETYASAEKRFVDDLIAANPGIIDLEMGLPASDLPGSAQVAPRMDLVVAQVEDGAPPAIAFWEAKCANNGELRASEEFQEREDGSFTGPKVLDQLGKYVCWMAEEGRIAQVRDAYRTTARTLLGLHRQFREGAAGEPECLQLWQALADAEAPAVIAQPGIVIGNYWPEGSAEGIASGRMAQCAASFARKGHREKLERNGIYLHEVGPNHKGAALPLLSPGSAAA